MENVKSFGEGVEKYWSSLITDIPGFVFLILLIILCLGVILFVTRKGIRKGLLYIARLILAEIVLIVILFTVFIRKTIEPLKYNFHPFWSYSAICDGKTYLWVQNVMNVGIFIPIGFLLGCSFPKLSWWKAIDIGVLFSMSIEVLQFIFKRGFSEIDDVMHNTLGCILGYVLYLISSMLVRKIKGL